MRQGIRLAAAVFAAAVWTLAVYAVASGSVAHQAITPDCPDATAIVSKF
jgi:hypothetical protein